MSCTNFYDVENSKVYKTINSNINNDVNGRSDTSLSIDENSNLMPKRNENLFKKNDTQSSVRERPTYLKLNSVSRPRNIEKPLEGSMRRHKSESDLLEELDRPKVLSRKKDNTLISKIYSNPQVRQFALSSRNQLPIDELTFVSSSGRQNVNRSYNSDDGMARSPVTIYNSNEDLLSPKINVPTSSSRNYQISNPKYSCSSENDILSETGSAHTENKSTKLSIYGSNKNLLGSNVSENDMQFIRIIPDDAKLNQTQNFLENSRISGSQESLLSDDPRRSSRTTSLLLGRAPRLGERTPSPDIEELVKKKIVHNILDQMERPQSDAILKKEAIDDEKETVHISVKDLRKRFENNDVSDNM